jgi:glycosyltransferase involved in cell wall biosynthesis
MIKKQKLAIIVEVDSFIGDIYHHLAKTYEVIAIQPRSMQEIDTAVQWADIVWFEFCNELFVNAINQNIGRLGKRVIARWHRFEIVESNFPARVNFNFIDDLILVSHDMLRTLSQRVPQLAQKTRTHVVWNGLNLNRFKPIASLDKKKIAWAAKPFMRKNAPMLLQIMHALVKRDPSYTLHIAGEQEAFVMNPYMQRTTEKLGLSNNVFYHGWQRDMPAFLADKGVILSTSIHESFGYNIAEAMAVGALPVIHDYPGAEEFWPDAIRFSSIDQAVEQILVGQTHLWSQYVREAFPLAKQLNAVDQIIGAAAAAPADAQPRPMAYADATPSTAVWQHAAPAQTQPAIAMQPLQQPVTVPHVGLPIPGVQPPLAMPAAPRPVAIQQLEPRPTVPTFDSNIYWENRDRSGGSLGAGSHDVLANYRARVLNLFAEKNAISSFAEMGSGDGNQLSFFNFPRYTGFDISQTTIERTRVIYREKPNYQFVWLGEPSLDWETHEDAYDCALSLDVLFHLVDDTIYVDYLDQLFSLSSRYVVIYASNFNGPDIRGASHVRHRKFTDDIAHRFPQWTLLKFIENPYKFKESTEADFAIYSLNEFENVSALNGLDGIR